MLKILRKGAIENPWFFRTIMFVIALTFVISMGWWGFSERAEPYVAQVDQTPISRIEYERQKEMAYRFYRDLLKESFKEEMVQQLVINNLVERRLWVKLARELNLSVGDPELRDAITQDSNFYDEQGRFDPNRYQAFLSRTRISAADYEQAVREELLIERAKLVLRDGIKLTDDEAAEAKASVVDPQLSGEKRQEEETRAIQNALVRKQQRVLSSVLNQVRSTTPIEIMNHLL